MMVLLCCLFPDGATCEGKVSLVFQQPLSNPALSSEHCVFKSKTKINCFYPSVDSKCFNGTDTVIQSQTLTIQVRKKMEENTYFPHVIRTIQQTLCCQDYGSGKTTLAHIFLFLNMDLLFSLHSLSPIPLPPPTLPPFAITEKRSWSMFSYSVISCCQGRSLNLDTVLKKALQDFQMPIVNNTNSSTKSHSPKVFTAGQWPLIWTCECNPTSSSDGTGFGSPCCCKSLTLALP